MKKVIIFLILFILLFWGFLQTSFVKQKTANFLADQIKKTTGVDVKIEKITFPLPLSLKIHKIEIFNEDKPLASIEEASFALPYWNIFNNTLKIPYLCCHQCNIQDEAIKAKLSKDIFPVDIYGRLTLDTKQTLCDIDLFLKRTNEINDDDTHIHLNFCGKDKKHFTLELLENNQGILSHLLNLGVPYDIALSLEAKEEKEDLYQGQFSLNFLHDDRVFHPSGNLAGQFSYALNDKISLSAIKGSFGEMDLDGLFKASLPDLKIEEGEFFIKIADSSKIHYIPEIQSSGSLHLKANVKGYVNNPNLDLEVISNNLLINGEKVKDIKGGLSLNKTDQGYEGPLLAEFIYKKQLFQATSYIRWNEENIDLKNIQANYGTTTIDGDLSYILDAYIVHGFLDATAEDSSIFNLLFDLDMKGSGKLKTKWYGVRAADRNLSEQDLKIVLEVDKARFHSLKVEKAILVSLVRNLYHDLETENELLAEKGIFNGWKFDRLMAATKTKKSDIKWPFSISTKDFTETGLAAETSGVWHADEKQFSINFEKLLGQFKSYPFSLQAPSLLEISPYLFKLTPFKLLIGEGFFHTNIEYSPQYAQSSSNFKRVPIEIFYAPNYHIPFEGLIDGEVNLFGLPGQLTGHLHALLSNIKIDDPGFSHMPLFKADINADIFADKIKGKASLSDITKDPVEMEIELPLHISLNPPEIDFHKDKPLNISLNAEGEIAPLLQLLIIDTSSLTGHTKVDIKVNGTYATPKISGTIGIKEGTFESPNTGALFNHLNADIEAKGRTLILKSLKALDINGGQVEGTGKLTVDNLHLFPFTLNLKIGKISILNQDFIKATADGDLQVKGDRYGAQINGNLKTDTVKVTIPEQSSTQNSKVDVKYINTLKNESPLKGDSYSADWPLELNVKIDVLDNATIKSKDLHSSWKGSIRVAGLTSSPLLYGDFKLVKGEYHFNGKALKLKEGTISFAGSPDKKSTLYVIASQDVGKIQAEVILRGAIKNPSIAFRSNPPLSQREILSYLLFGRGVGEITPFQGAELSQSIKDLTKEKKEEDVLSKIRNKIGIDRIDITKSAGNESNEVSVQLGKYISPNIFVSVNKGITCDANQVSIEAALLPNIRCEAQVGDDSSAKLQLKWQRDY